MLKTIIITERPDLKTSELLALCKEKFSVWSYYSDAEIDKLCPAPKEATVRQFLDSPEPDPETLGMSYDDCIEKGIDMITPRERILLELAYWEKYGKGLDIKGWTITGALDSDGCAMSMCRGGNGRFYMVRYARGDRNSVLGPRQLVSNSFSGSLTLDRAIKVCKENGLTVTNIY